MLIVVASYAGFGLGLNRIEAMRAMAACAADIPAVRGGFHRLMGEPRAHRAELGQIGAQPHAMLALGEARHLARMAASALCWSRMIIPGL